MKIGVIGGIFSSAQSIKPLGSLEDMLSEQNENFVEKLYQIRDYDMRLYQNPAFPGTNRQARRKADREAKRNLKKKRN